MYVAHWQVILLSKCAMCCSETVCGRGVVHTYITYMYACIHIHTLSVICWQVALNLWSCSKTQLSKHTHIHMYIYTYLYKPIHSQVARFWTEPIILSQDKTLKAHTYACVRTCIHIQTHTFAGCRVLDRAYYLLARQNSGWKGGWRSRGHACMGEVVREQIRASS
jgi:hypothetical protein